MRTSAGGSVQEGPYYVYVLNTGFVGYHHKPYQRLNQIQELGAGDVIIVWVSKPFPDREDAKRFCARLNDKRDFEPPVFLRICRCEYDQTDTGDVLVRSMVPAANP